MLLVTALIFGLFMINTYFETPIYQSQARVLVENVVYTPSGLGNFPNIETESELVRSEPVAELAASELGMDLSAETMLEGLSVAVATQTEILVINYASSGPEIAQQRAQAFAEGYLAYRRQQVVEDLETAISQFETRLQAVNQQVSDLTRELNAADSVEERASLQVSLNTSVSQLALLEQQRNEITPPELVNVGQVVAPALLPTAPSSPNVSQNAILGLFFGLLAGFAAAVLRERLDDRLRGRQDVESKLGVPVLAVIPRVSSWRRSAQPYLATRSEPHSVVSEAYKSLRTSTMFVASNKQARILMMTGPHPEEGKTATLANLAVALAQAERRVIAVSADLRRPRLHTFFEVSNDRGVTTMLAGETELSETLQRVGVDKLRIMASGPPPGNPAELLGSEQMGELLEALRANADFVLVDAPPVLGVADATILAPMVDGVILVVDTSKSTRNSVAHAVQQLAQVDAVMLGGVLNNFDVGKNLPYGNYEKYLVRAESDGSPPRGRNGVLSRLRKGVKP